MKLVCPLRDNVLVEVLPDEWGTTRIIIPETVNPEHFKRGRALAVGPGRLAAGRRVPNPVRCGDVVIFHALDDQERMEINDRTCLLLKGEQIWAVLDE